MSVSIRHLLQQGPVLRSLLGVAAGAVTQRFQKQEQPEQPKTPSVWLSQELPIRSERLVRDYIKWSGGTAARYEGELPPHLFPHWGFPLMAQTLKDLPYPMTGVLNQGCRLVREAPLRADQKLHLKARLESIQDDGKKARLHQRLITGTKDNPEALQADVYAVVKLRSSEKKGQREKPQLPEGAAAIGTASLRESAGRDFALLTGDFNPIHWIKPAAKAAGFKGMILHGFAALALTIERLNDHLEESKSEPWESIDVRFVRPLVLPNEATVYTAPTYPESEERLIHLVDQKGEICMLGHYRCKRPLREAA